MSKDDKKNVYKDTLNLPDTAFDMRAGLLQKEPQIQAQWKQTDLYGRIRAARKGSERFILHDGPPYANGNIHMGTALNKVLKDLVVRIQNMTGHDSPYIPGWDCHGLPIEAKVMKELGGSAMRMSATDIRSRCKTYAQGFANVQSEQFQRLGVMGEFGSPYMTMAPQYEAAVMETFARLIEQGLVYRQLKPVHWSIENRTALADAELEYQDRDDTSIFVAFRLIGGNLEALPACAGAEAALLIWTTTPWTLPANLAVAIHPGYTYACVRAETAGRTRLLVVAEQLVEPVFKAIEARRPGFVKSRETVGTIKGRDLLEAGLVYAHPLVEDRPCPVVPAEYVTLEDGTGLVHTAPGHGMEDYGTALKCGLEVYCPVQADGTFDDTAPAWLHGVDVWHANPMVVKFLDEAGALMLEQPIRHSYPHDWRSKTPTIFRATEQWFISVDRPMAQGKHSLRELAMDACRKEPSEGGVEFVPAWGRNRMAGMLESRPDWCISRQRAWGLPIPAFFNAQGQPLMTPASVRAVARVVAAKGSDAWFTCTPAELLAGYDPCDDKYVENADEFPVDALTPGRDILDVWFESGSSWAAVAVARGLVADIPVDLYLEGSDQHRGWFQLSLLPALGALGKAPFRTLLTHGFVVDEHGRKMSKSEGNVIDVIAQLGKRGADILRLWVASQDYQDDVRCSESLIAQAEDAYRKIRNTLRFLMGACSGFDPAVHATEPSPQSLDRWMLIELHRLIRDVRAAYDHYEFHRATRMMYEFCTVQASSVYLSAVKDRLYCDAADSPRRRSCQTVIYQTLDALVRLLAPILPHTCEEAWAHVPAKPADAPDSVHLTMLPEHDEQFLRMEQDMLVINPDMATFVGDEVADGPAWTWTSILALRDEALVKLEALRNAGVKNPMDAEAVFRVGANDERSAALITSHLGELEDLLGVGYARIERVESLPEGKAVDVELLDSREKYQRCARCWKRRPDVGSNPKFPDLSARDAAVMEKLSAK